MTDSVDRELGNHAGRLTVVEEDLLQFRQRQEQILEKLIQIELSLAERKGVERVAYWLAATVGGLAVTIATHTNWNWLFSGGKHP